MHGSFLVLLLLISSCLSWSFGRRWFSLAPGKILAAVGGVFEVVGLGFFFLCLNLLIGAGIVALFRWSEVRFLTPYMMDDLVFLALSCVQGLMFYLWRLRSAQGAGSG